MKYFLLLIIAVFAIQCASTKQSRPYVEGVEKESSFDHIEGLPKDMKVLTESPDFKSPTLIGGMTYLKEVLTKLNRQTPCPVRGEVHVEFVVGVYGQIISPQTVLSIHETCDAIAEKAISYMNFVAAKKGGNPIKMKMTMPVNFQ